MATITTTGIGRQTVTPNLARLSVTNTLEHPHQAKAFSLVAAATSELAEVLKESSIPSQSIATTGVRVEAVTRWINDREERMGYRGVATTSITVEDISIVAALCESIAVRVPESTISGPNWTISSDHPVHSQARRAAALDAQARAEDFASGLQLEILGVLEASDAPLSSLSQQQPHMDMMFSRASGDVQGGLTMESGELEVLAQLTVRFETRPATN